jgi:glycosyltransferase involved in cell wall biosynthesis
MQNTFVLIPAYNEDQMIRSVIEELLPYGYSLVVIDDGSLPGLYPLLKGVPVYFLRHRVNLGQGASLQTGMEFALSRQAQYIVTFDADGQHDAADIGRLLQVLADGKADIVLGSRFKPGASRNVPLLRKMLLQSARYLNYIFTGLLLTDAHNGLRAMTGRAAGKIRIRENGMSHATEFLSQIKKKRLRYAELPVSVRYSDYSKQKGQTVWDGFRIFFDLILNKIFR